jgi:hypothetical protein
MQRESDGLEPLGKIGQQILGLFLGGAVDDRVIRVAFERAYRIVPIQPICRMRSA